MQTKLILGTPAGALRTQENDVEMDYDGGRVVLTADSQVFGRKSDLQQMTLVLNYSEDEPMREWPTSRQERAERRFTALILEDATEAQLAQIRQILGSSPQ
jgi:hypothetical protein